MAADLNSPLIRFLLDEMNQADQLDVMTRLIAEPEFQQELDGAADDLASLYVNQSLNAAQRARFESKFLAAPEWQARIAFARDVGVLVSRMPSAFPNTRAAAALPHAFFELRWIFAAAIAAALAMAAVLWFRPGGFRTESLEVAAVVSPARLLYGDKSVNEVSFTMPQFPAAIEFRLAVQAGRSPAYAAELHDLPGGNKQDLGSFKPRLARDGRSEVVIRVVSTRLTTGRHAIVLLVHQAGKLAEAGTYPFRINPPAR
jgi:hypothetical protein